MTDSKNNDKGNEFVHPQRRMSFEMGTRNEGNDKHELVFIIPSHQRLKAFMFLVGTLLDESLDHSPGRFFTCSGTLKELDTPQREHHPIGIASRSGAIPIRRACIGSASAKMPLCRSSYYENSGRVRAINY